MNTPPDVVAIVPCLNEEATVASVVMELTAALPVHHRLRLRQRQHRPHRAGRRSSRGDRPAGVPAGKGHVLRRAFGDVQGDVFVVVTATGPMTCRACRRWSSCSSSGPYDQVVGVRREADRSAYRAGHSMGNIFFNRMVGRLFGEPVQDMLSGFRVLSRRFVKSFPVRSRGFEVETELTVHAVDLRRADARTSTSPSATGLRAARASCAPTTTVCASSA